MAYSITTKDGIKINNIPDNIQPDDPSLKARVAKIREGNKSQSMQQQDVPSAVTSANVQLQNKQPSMLSKIDSAIAGALSGGSRASLFDTGFHQINKEPLSVADKLIGGIETGASLATMIPAIAGGYAGLLTPSSGKNAEERFAGGMQKMIYQPRTEAGQRMLESTSQVLQPLQAIAPMSQISALSRIKPVAGAPVLPKNEALSQAAGISKSAASKLLKKTTPVVKTLIEPFKAVKAGLYDPVVNQPDLITSALTRTIGKENIPDVIKGLERQAKTPGVQFSAGQATGSPALAAIEDTLRAINPSGELNLQSAKNRTALAKGLTDLAQDELSVAAAKQARTLATEPLYKSLEDATVMGGAELDSLLARLRASGALQQAEQISKIKGKKFNIPVIEEPKYGQMTQADLAPVFETSIELPKRLPLEKEPVSLAGYLRSTGGISKDYIRDVTGETNPRQSGAAVGLFTNKARSMDDSVQRAVEGGYLPESVLNEVDGGVSALTELLATEIQQKQKVYPMNFDVYSRNMAAEYNATPQEVTRMIGEPSRIAAPVQGETVIGNAIKGDDLINLKKGIDQAIKQAEPNSPLQLELLNLKSDYMNWLDNQGKGFLEANNKFAELSKPINQMEVGKLLSEKLIPATAEETPSTLNAAQLARALKNKDMIAQKVTGIKGAKLNKVLTKQQLETILGINSDASRIAEMQKLGAGYGSPTARRLSATEFIGENFKQQAPVTSKVIEILNNVPLLNYATKGVGTAGSFISKQLNLKMTNELERMLASDPQKISNALKKEIGLINSKKIKVDYINPLEGRYIEPGLLGGTISTVPATGILNYQDNQQ
jgi:hypothetical protein